MAITVNDFKKMKAERRKIAVLTAYDYPTARLVDEAGIPAILVGDSLGMVALGYDSTLPVTMEVMLHHIKAVARGVRQAMIIGDLPFMSYHLSTEQALQNAARFLQEGGAHAVKLEGGVTVADKVRRIVDCGIPVMGHIGLTPQSVHGFGGFRVQGKTLDSARRIFDDAVALEQAGAFSIVLETIPSELADIISRKLSVPTIGIGAGAECDGQVQVLTDLLGFSSDKPPKHAGQYASLHEVVKRAAGEYMRDVIGSSFPTGSHCLHLEQSVLDDLDNFLKGLER